MLVSHKDASSDRSVDRSSGEKSVNPKHLLLEANALEKKENEEVLRAATVLAKKEKQAKEVLARTLLTVDFTCC